MSVEQVISAILALSLEERRQLARWLDNHRAELFAASTAEESPAVKRELLRRQQEYYEHPEWFVSMDEPALDRMLSEISEEVRQSQSPGFGR